MITEGKLDRNYGIKATVKVAPVQGSPAHSGEVFVLFQLMKGSMPVSIAAVERDITTEEDVTAHFSADPIDHSYRVRVYVLDSFTSDLTSVPRSLAEMATLQ